ncbi:MAG: DUF4325 domain-containing protein [Bdellovibrionales bacterium]|nr:DUF4325 domain-containing protein [Bdellovibrionales bacterium]
MQEGPKEKILSFIKKNNEVSSKELTHYLGISRQMIARHLSELIEQGKIQKSGSTKKAIYRLAKKNSLIKKTNRVKLLKKLSKLSEDQVFSEVELRLNLKEILSNNVHSICYYAFTEMLNNAMDHSGAKTVEILAELTHSHFHFSIRDKGIGIFNHVKKTFQFENEYQGLEHIIKGKQTTFPEAHSGQGIFFTSRIADEFEIKSHKINYRVFNNEKVVGEIAFLKGTLIDFKIKRHSRKKLKDLFWKYANEDFEFDRTDVRVKLDKSKKLISRSQAKKILLGLDDFKIITLDFKGVEEVGQGFIDEIFHVFKKRHPGIQVIYVNANPAVEFMIQRV